MKNIFQGVRDLPDYPRLAIRLIAFLFVLFGIGNLIVGATLNISNQYKPRQEYSKKDLDTLRNQTIPLVEQISFIQGMTPLAFEQVMDHYSDRLYYSETRTTLSDHVYPGANGINYGAYTVIFWGVVFIVTALLLLAGFHKITLMMLIVWIIYSCIVMINFITPTRGLPLFSNEVRLFDERYTTTYIMNLLKPSLISIFAMVVVPLLIGALLIFDERLKAYFGEGRFAEGYKTYFIMRKAMRRSRGERKPLPNPWIVEKTT